MYFQSIQWAQNYGVSVYSSSTHFNLTDFYLCFVCYFHSDEKKNHYEIGSWHTVQSSVSRWRNKRIITPSVSVVINWYAVHNFWRESSILERFRFLYIYFSILAAASKYTLWRSFRLHFRLMLAESVMTLKTISLIKRRFGWHGIGITWYNPIAQISSIRWFVFNDFVRIRAHERQRSTTIYIFKQK